LSVSQVSSLSSSESFLFFMLPHIFIKSGFFTFLTRPSGNRSPKPRYRGSFYWN
jgi:hypothetical protein